MAHAYLAKKGDLSTASSSERTELEQELDKTQVAVLPVETLMAWDSVGIHPLIGLVGPQRFKRFKLSDLGRKYIDETIEGLKTVAVPEFPASFGYAFSSESDTTGYPSLREIVRNDEGRLMVALGAALMELYSEDIAVQIIVAFYLISAPTMMLADKLEEWKRFLKACAGILAASGFSVLAEQYMSGHILNTTLGPTATPTTHTQLSFEPVQSRIGPSFNKFRNFTDPHVIAEALHKLARTGKGPKPLMIEGGNDIAWLGAFAQFFLALTVGFSLRNNGSIISQTVVPGNPQVLITIDHGRACKRSRDASERYQREGYTSESMVVAGRLKWEDILAMTFAGSFQDLLKCPREVGTAIGSASIIFQCLVEADPALPESWSQGNAFFCRSSYGLDLVQNTIRWFPELTAMKDQMLLVRQSSLTSALEHYTASMISLRKSCLCTRCGHKPGEHKVTSIKEICSGRAWGSVGSRSIVDENRFCLVLIVETIICVSRSLAAVTLHERILPRRSGLMLAYRRQFQARSWARSPTTEEEKKLGPIVMCLDWDESRLRDFNKCDVILKNILTLFSGELVDDPSSKNICALSCKGITVFLETSYEKRTNIFRAHVIPGFIAAPSCASRITDPLHALDPTIKRDGSKFLVCQPITPKKNEEVWEIRLRLRDNRMCDLLLMDKERRQNALGAYIGPSQLMGQIAARSGLIVVSEPIC
ncbi:hypothetical protein BT63DRAFT_417398 [Microthyrium microscopicum]|uniref:Uncharacterized protein n=1 Tax=Microthyrium microscopicum TaxID=703497 RepID=A0A6A6U095_9PEZI|nr:hypothetical protein BT63DRAFT_417398 [Microthyrium microscopicum]